MMDALAWIGCGLVTIMGIACHWADAQAAKNDDLRRKADGGTT